VIVDTRRRFAALSEARSSGFAERSSVRADPARPPRPPGRQSERRVDLSPMFA
jgi:hypothetical protein